MKIITSTTSAEDAATRAAMIAAGVLRPAPGKREAVLLDLAGSSCRHGSPLAPRRWSLEGDAALQARAAHFAAKRGRWRKGKPIVVHRSPLSTEARARVAAIMGAA